MRGGGGGRHAAYKNALGEGEKNGGVRERVKGKRQQGGKKERRGKEERAGN